MKIRAILILIILLLAVGTLHAQETVTYTVQRGDSLTTIAREYCTTVRELYDLNRAVIGINPNIIFAGSQLQVIDGCAAGEAPPTPVVLPVAPEGVGVAYSSEVISCPDFILGPALVYEPGSLPDAYPEQEVAGETFECGLVYVPENYAEPDGRVLGLFYVRLFSTSDSPAADPLIYLSGGPGASAAWELGFNTLQTLSLNIIRQDRDVIVYDQRGTGFSNYLGCELTIPTIGILFEEFDPENVELLDSILNAGENSGGSVIQSLCMRVYDAATNVDITQYQSVASTQDIAHLAETLGYTSGYNLYGTSYGTRLAHYALRETPDNVRSAVMDGVLPPTIRNTAVTFASRYEVYLSIFVTCAADEACNAAYPNLVERFANLLETLETTPFELEEPLIIKPRLQVRNSSLLPSYDSITPDFFTHLAASLNGVLQGGPVGAVPRTILALEEGDSAYLYETYGYQPEPAPDSGEQSGLGNQGVIAPPYQASQPLFQAPISTLLQLGQAEIDPNGSLAMVWNSIVWQELATNFTTSGDETDLVAEIVAWSLLPTEGFDAQALVTYADAHLSEAAARQANAVVARMSWPDVRATMWTIQDIAMSMSGKDRHDSFGAQTLVNCAEDTRFATDELAADYLAQSPFPQLLIFPLESNTYIVAGCVGYTPSLPDSINTPVESAIPVLLYGEALDTNTPISWTYIAHETLSNSYVVEWENMGHVAAAHDTQGCVGGIAAAFLNDPSTEPDSSCTADDFYHIHFELPE